MPRQVLFWLVALCGALLFFWYLQDILLPFIAGFVLAYFLDPLATRLTKLGLPRLAATALIMGSTVLVLALVVTLVVPSLVNQIGKLAVEIPRLSMQFVEIINTNAPTWLKDLVANNGGDFQTNLSNYAGKAALWLAGFASTLWSGSKALLNVFSLLLITPVVAFYLLNDWTRLVARIDTWLPRQHLDNIRTIARDIDTALSAFVRGQGAVCLVMATYYALGYWAIGLKAGFAIGLASGLLTFIPFFGASIGGAAALLTGFLQFWPNEMSLLAVAGVLIVGQFTENNFLSPKLVGDSIGLHPVMMMLALLGFSYIFGLLGLMLAVPLAAATAVLVRHGLMRYLSSDIYLGHAPPHE